MTLLTSLQFPDIRAANAERGGNMGASDVREQNQIEKLALIFLAGGCILSLTLVARWVIGGGKVDPNAATLLGSIVTGMAAFSVQIVNAIRSYATSAQLEKVTTQLAASGPMVEPVLPPSADAPEAAQVVADAAQDTADSIKDVMPKKETT